MQCDAHVLCLVCCLCLMIEYIIKSPLGLYRLLSGKWIHDITRIDE